MSSLHHDNAEGVLGQTWECDTFTWERLQLAKKATKDNWRSPRS